VHGFDAGAAQVGFQRQVEVRRVHAHKDVRARCQQTLAQLAAHAQDADQAGKHVPAIAMYGQALAGPPGVKAALHHVLTTHAKAAQLRPARVQAVQQ